MRVYAAALVEAGTRGIQCVLTRRSTIAFSAASATSATALKVLANKGLARDEIRGLHQGAAT